MIIGLFIKNYKTYQNITFIPFIKNTEHKLSIFIGPNGAGKSSILEALDTLFNDRGWNTNINSKKGEGFICPVFLIPKRERLTNKAIPYISDFFWSYQIPQHTGAASYEAWQEFVSYREDIKKTISTADYYLIVAGIDEDFNTSYTSTHNSLKNSFKSKGIKFEDHDKALKIILNRYRFIYLPIHNSPTNLLDLKARELQALLDKNFVKEIDQILSKDDSSSSPIKSINEHLERFLSDINNNLKVLDDDYQYKTQHSYKITASDITEITLRKYFSERPLQKDGKPIESLSSGEQRMAIIDVAHAFLSKGTNTNKEIILSIDEPEASLNPINCLRQFKRIFEITTKFKKQAIISTHWYGLLTTPENATLNFIQKTDDKPTIKSLDLSRIQEERRNFPDSFEMKSYFDLVSSILSIMKSDNQNWLICEGHDDQNYIKKMIGESTKAINILPAGGRGGVIKIYEYLRIAAEDRAERGLLKGKILCIVDSDAEIIQIPQCSKEAKKHIKILRFQITKNEEADLVEPTSSGHYTETELEDTLSAEDYYNAAKYIIERRATNKIKEAFNGFKLNPKAIHARINDDLHFLRPTTIRFLDAKSEIKDFLTQTETKAEISKIYKHTKQNPAWVETIKLFFGTPQKTEHIETKARNRIDPLPTLPTT